MQQNTGERLTRRYLFSLPEGVYLASGCGDQDGPRSYKPAWADHVAAPEKRQEQWEAIKAARADGRACGVFANEAAWREFVATICWPESRAPM